MTEILKKKILKSVVGLLLPTLVFIQQVHATTVLSTDLITLEHAPRAVAATDFHLRVLATPGPSDLMACGAVIEVPGTYLCVPKSKDKMNDALLRMGFFWGTGCGFKAGTLIPKDDQVLKTYNNYVFGHNLPGDVITNYFNTVAAIHDSRKSLNSAEQDFFLNFVQTPEILRLHSQYYLIAAVASGNTRFHSVLSHEIHHARYYLQPKYKSIVDLFWKNEISERDKNQIRQILGYSYNADNENTMVDEGQAYILEENADQDILARYVGKYRAKLESELKAAE